MLDLCTSITSYHCNLIALFLLDAVNRNSEDLVQFGTVSASSAVTNDILAASMQDQHSQGDLL